MNIWIFNHYAIPPSFPGGTRHFDIGRELVKRHHRVTIFSSSFHHLLQREMIADKSMSWREQEFDGVKFVWIKTPPYTRNDWRRVRNMLSYAIRSVKLGKRLTRERGDYQKPDVIIGSTVHLLAGWVAYRLARRYKAKFIMEVRDLWPQTIIEMGELKQNSLLTKFLQGLERFLYRKADLIVTLLPRANKYIESLGIPGSKIVWIPNGADLANYAVRDQKPQNRSQFRVIYVGAHGQANALGVLISAAEILQQQGHSHIQFILIGDGPEKPKLVASAEAARLKNLEFRDAVRKEAIPALLADSDAAVVVLHNLPIYKYGISLNKIYDYMATGLPVVLAGSPAADPVAEAGCGISVPPDDPEALAAGILHLSKLSGDELFGIGMRGRSYVESNHSMRVLGDRWESVLKV